jgi:hypothetical protein
MGLFPGCNRRDSCRQIAADLSAKAKKPHVAPQGGGYHFCGKWLVASRALGYEFDDVKRTEISEFQRPLTELPLQKLLHIAGSIQNGVLGKATRRSQVVFEFCDLRANGCRLLRDGNWNPSGFSESIKKELQGRATFFHTTITGGHATTVSEVFVEK